MAEAMILLAIGIGGAAFLVPFVATLSRGAAFVLGPIVGTSVFVLVSIVLVSIGWFSVVRGTLLVAVAGVAVMLGTWQRRRWRAVGPDLAIVGATGAAALVVGVVVSNLFITRVTFDSFIYMMAGDALESSGTMASMPFSFDEVLKRQLVIPAIQSTGAVTGLGYSTSWIPLVGISGLLSMAWLGWRSMTTQGVRPRTRGWVIAAVVALICTTNLVWTNLFYVNGHMVFASMLVAAVGLGWLAVTGSMWSLLVVSGVLFGALVPTRAEAVAVAVIFIVPALVIEAIPNWARWSLAGPAIAATFAWYGWGIEHGFPSVDSTVAGNLVLAGALAVFVVVCNRRWAGWLRRTSVLALVVLPILAMLVQLVRSFPDVRETIASIGTNLSSEGLWGATWWVLPLLVIGAAIGTSFREQTMFLAPLASFAGLLPLLAVVRGVPFRVGWSDSGNRILLHVTLVVCLYLMLAAGAAAAAAPTGGAASEPKVPIA